MTLPSAKVASLQMICGPATYLQQLRSSALMWFVQRHSPRERPVRDQ